MKHLRTALATLCLALATQAPALAQPAGVVHISSAQRVFQFYGWGYRIDDEGKILVCPQQYRGGSLSDRQCQAEGDKEKNARWVELNKFTIPGHDLHGISFDSVNGTPRLTVFFSKNRWQ